MRIGFCSKTWHLVLVVAKICIPRFEPKKMRRFRILSHSATNLLYDQMVDFELA